VGVGLGAFIARARQIEFLEACMKETVSREKRTITVGVVKLSMKSRRMVWIIVRQRTLERIGTDLRSAELGALARGGLGGWGRTVLR